MFLKNAQQRAPLERRRHQGSITRRLVITYTLSAIAMLVISAVFHNWALHNSLLKSEQNYIEDRIRVYRGVIEHSHDFLYFIMQDIEWQASFVNHPQYYSRLLNDKCHIIIETAHMNELVPPESFPGSCATANGMKNLAGHGKSTVYQGKNGRLYLLESYWSKTAHPTQRIAIQIAIDITAQENIIRTNQRQMIAIILLGILFAVLFSVAIAKRVLSPLNKLADTAKQITIDKITMRDTAPHRWPVELQALAIAFNDMLHRLNESYIVLSQYTSNLAHELRTPINNLVGETEVALSQERTAAEYRKVLESGLEEHMRLSHMVDSLLFLARNERASSHVESSMFDPLEEIIKVCSFYEALAEEKQARITWSGSGLMYGNAGLFRRVMSNLISNALYYSQPGVKIETVVRDTPDNYFEVVVSDTGHGIAENDINRIFDRFYRVMSSRSNNPQGSGLGLSIVKSIMELHNGTVSIQSVPNQGTTVTLRFPAHPGQVA